MNTMNGPIDADGALVDVLIELSAAAALTLRNSGLAVPAPVPLRAVIDTAAEVTCIDTQALAPFVAAGATRRRFVLANLPALGGLMLNSEYAMSVTLVHTSGNPRANLVLRNLPVLEQTLGPLGYQALLGRDVLEYCLFIYDGRSKTFLLAF
jgi:hypothetical protein